LPPATARPAPADRPPVDKAPDPALASAGPFVVQLASFSKRENALALRDALKDKGYRASVARSTNGALHRLFVGPYTTPANAADAVIKLRGETGLAGVVRRTDAL